MFSLLMQFGDSQKLRLVRILRSTVMVRVGGGWVALDEFLVKNDPCRGKSKSMSKTISSIIHFVQRQCQTNRVHCLAFYVKEFHNQTELLRKFLQFSLYL